MMNDIKLSLLNKVITWLAGGELVKFVQMAVRNAQATDMSSEDKRLWVQGEVKRFIFDASNLMVNLVIEVAVVLLRAQLDKEA